LKEELEAQEKLSDRNRSFVTELFGNAEKDRRET
jgi:hypothetical protein